LSRLAEQRCKPLPAGTPALTPAQIEEHLRELPGWTFDKGAIAKTFSFPDYHRAMAFVNAVAWIAHSEDHHPEMSVSYNCCTIRYSTHSIGGISDNDFVCAAKIEALQR
jgi:4a-hydroxytetrahydrobiopterin dehydratase